MPLLRSPRLQRLVGCVAAAVLLALALSLTTAFADATGASASATRTKADTKSASSTRTAARPAPALAWTTPTPASEPPQLIGAAAAYDPDTQSVVLFGGINQATNTYSSATWVWDGSSWSKHSGGPAARAYASMAYDPSLHQLVLYGGESSSGGYFSDTWTWNGRAWYQPTASTCPPARDGAALAYDQAGDLVLFGGTGLPPTMTPATTDAQTPTSATGSAGEGPASNAATPSSASTAATSTCTGTQAAPAGSTPQALDDTWHWNGASWTEVPTSTSPPALGEASFSYDSTTGTTVLFGGTTASDKTTSGTRSDQTWIWNGSGWKQQPTKTSPPARSGGLLADVPALSGDVLAGGTGAGGTALADAWVWSNGSWVRAAATGQERAAGSPAGGYDAADSRLVLFDGQAGLGSSVTELAEPVTATTSKPGSTSTPRTTPTTTPTSPTTDPPTRTTQVASPAPTRSAPVGTKRSTPPKASPPPATASRAPAPSLTASSHRVKRGTSVRLAGTGFEPGTTVTLTFHSKPYLLGEVQASTAGAFSAYAVVPASAAPGEHHFEATGKGPNGKIATLDTAVFVLDPSAHHGTSAVVKAVMFGVALLIPGAAWLGMSGVRWRRRRLRSAGTASS